MPDLQDHRDLRDRRDHRDHRDLRDRRVLSRKFKKQEIEEFSATAQENKTWTNRIALPYVSYIIIYSILCSQMFFIQTLFVCSLLYYV